MTYDWRAMGVAARATTVPFEYPERPHAGVSHGVDNTPVPDAAFEAPKKKSLVGLKMRICDMPVGTAFKIYSEYIKVSQTEISDTEGVFQTGMDGADQREIVKDPVVEKGDYVICLPCPGLENWNAEQAGKYGIVDRIDECRSQQIGSDEVLRSVYVGIWKDGYPVVAYDPNPWYSSGAALGAQDASCVIGGGSRR